MAHPLTRADLFRGRIRPRAAVLRPPWSLDETPFRENCTRCDDCLKACETHILVRDDEGYPAVDFSRGECTFCAACRSACTRGAILPARNPASEAAPPWKARAVIGNRCIELAGTACRVCADQCPESAIRIRRMAGGRGVPLLQAETCTGCGACVAPCPSGAIHIEVAS